MKHRTTLAAVFLVLCPFAPALAAPPVPATQPAAPPDADPFVNFNKNWHTDSNWEARLREVARYAITSRNATLKEQWNDTSLEQADPRSKNRADNPYRENTRKVVQQLTYTAGGRDIVQQSLVFIGADDFKSLRVDATILDLHGSTYKQFINHKGTLEWHQFSNAPDEGHKTGSYNPPKNLVYENALPTLLRGYPFEGDHTPLHIALLPNQLAGTLTATDPVPATITFVGLETLELMHDINPNIAPEKWKAFHLAVTPDVGDASHTLHYWFAAEHDHVLIRSETHGEVLLLENVRLIEK